MWLVNRLKEGSTWRGITMLLTAAGVSLSPEQMGAIVTAGMTIAGAIGVFWPEKK